MTNAIKANMSSLTRRLDKILAPLNKREEKLAIESAVALLTADREIREDARCRVLGAELAIERPAKIGALPKRRIRVLITDYSAGRNLEYLVEAGKVVESHSRVPSVEPSSTTMISRRMPGSTAMTARRMRGSVSRSL